MTIMVRWDDPERTAVRWDIGATWTWEEFEAALHITRTKINNAPQPVALIFNTREDTTLPPDFLITARRYIREPNPRITQMVLIGKNTFVTVMFGVLQRVTPIDLPVVSSLREARGLVRTTTTTSH